MSSESFAESPAGVLAAWETEKQVYFGRIDPATGTIRRSPLPGLGQSQISRRRRKCEGRNNFRLDRRHGLEKGRPCAWQVYNKDGRPTQERGKVDGVPVWSLVAAFARPDGGFTIVHLAASRRPPLDHRRVSRPRRQAPPGRALVSADRRLQPTHQRNPI